MSKHSLGVVIGRFQVPSLTVGHRALIQYALDRHSNVLVLIGTSPTRGGKNNPLSFTQRALMLRMEFSGETPFVIREIADNASDKLWSDAVDSQVRSFAETFESEEVLLYGGRDSFISSYSGSYATETVAAVDSRSGTDVRRITGKLNLTSAAFRAGIIFSTQNCYPISYQTVDIAILHPPAPAEKGGKRAPWQVLLGRKPGETTWRFPGGFVDPTDRSLESAAFREAKEETNVTATVLNYIGSYRMNDWRYRGEVDQIMTAFFRTEVAKGQEKAGDDLQEIKWFEIGEILPVMSPTHLELAWQLIGSLNSGLYKSFGNGQSISNRTE